MTAKTYVSEYEPPTNNGNNNIEGIHFDARTAGNSVFSVSETGAVLATSINIGGDSLIVRSRPSDGAREQVCLSLSLSLSLSLRVFYSILVVSCFMWSCALDCAGVLLSYPIMLLALYISNILISTLLRT